MTRTTTVDSPIGDLLLLADDDGALTGLSMQAGPRPFPADPA
jgi:hypothetical protein